MQSISKYVVVDGEKPIYVLYKTPLTPEKNLFQLLQLTKLEEWNYEYKLAIDGESELAFITGVGQSESGYENVNALMFGDDAFFIGDDIYITDGIHIQNVSGCRYKEVDDEYKMVCFYESESLTLPFSAQNVAVVQALVDQRKSDFLFDTDEYDREFVVFRGSPDSFLASLSKESKNTFTHDWDDPDDLVALSCVWPLTLEFE